LVPDWGFVGTWLRFCWRLTGAWSLGNCGTLAIASLLQRKGTTFLSQMQILGAFGEFGAIFVLKIGHIDF